MIPLVDKDNAYKRFIAQNKWVKDYWCNAIKITKVRIKKKNNIIQTLLKPLNKICFYLQYLYMRKRITNEYIAENMALFHPNDVSKSVNLMLNKLKEKNS